MGWTNLTLLLWEKFPLLTLVKAPLPLATFLFVTHCFCFFALLLLFLSSRFRSQFPILKFGNVKKPVLDPTFVRCATAFRRQTPSGARQTPSGARQTPSGGLWSKKAKGTIELFLGEGPHA